MTRRDWFAAAAAAPALLAQRPKPPNVLIILTDDQGFGDLGCHGNPHLRTPNLDGLARAGVEFTRFCVSPVCSPTRSSLMTGRYHYRTGVVDTYLGRSLMYSEEVTLAEMLAAAGYRTGIFGKWHLGDNYPLRAIDQGFQQAVVLKGGGLRQPSDIPGGGGYFDPILLRNGKPERFRGYCTDIFTGQALDFLERQSRDPFFLYLALNAPHEPLEVDDSWTAPYRQAGLDEPTRKVYGMVANLDHNVGRLLARLRELGLEDDTIVVFLTDNGPAADRYNAGLRGRKGTVYEGGIRVPLFFRWPRVAAGGRKVDRLAAHIDLAPTLLEACGVPAPKDVRLDGVSLMPLVRGRPGPWPGRTLFFQWHRGDEPQPFRNCAACTQRWKLVHGRELFDLRQDAAEKRDVAARHPDVVSRLRRAYEAWFRDVSSTRGYAPPRIHLGSPRENPVILTRQDWRGPHAGWNPDSLGFWEVRVTRAGNYKISVLTAPAPAGGEVRFSCNGAVLAKAVSKGSTGAALGAVSLAAGDGRLEAEIRAGSFSAGVHYVTVERLDP